MFRVVKYRGDATNPSLVTYRVNVPTGEVAVVLAFAAAFTTDATLGNRLVKLSLQEAVGGGVPSYAVRALKAVGPSLVVSVVGDLSGAEGDSAAAVILDVVRLPIPRVVFDVDFNAVVSTLGPSTDALVNLEFKVAFGSLKEMADAGLI